MKTTILFLMSCLFIIFIINSCKTDDDEMKQTKQESTSLNGGDVYRYQMVSINVPNTQVNVNEYNASLGGSSVKLIRTDDNKLSFMIPINFPLGSTDLIVPNLNNLKIKYNILEPKLEQSIDETMAPLMSKFEDYFANINVSSVYNKVALNNFNQFKNSYQISNIEDKKQVALWYMVNKEVINSIFFSASIGGKFDSTLFKSTLGVFKIAVSKCGIVGGVMTAAVGGALGVTVMGALLVGAGLAVAGIGVAIAVQEYEKLAVLPINTVEMNLNGTAGTNNKSNIMHFIDNQTTTLSFQSKSRHLIQGDSNNQKPMVSDFFSLMSNLNNSIDDQNNIAVILNGNGSKKYETFDEVALGTNANFIEGDVTSELMKNIKFSTGSSNLQLQTATLKSDGQLDLKMKIIGTPTAFPIKSTLNYSYNDDFNTFSGYFNIEVDISIQGTWVCESFENGIPVGTYFDIPFSACPNVASQAYTVLNQDFIIGATVFSFTEKEKYKYYNKVVTNCSVTSDEPDTYEEFPASGNGTYTYDAGIITAQIGGGTKVLPIQFLSPDKIKIEDRIYKRQ